jgi:hypothetical protein
MKALFFFLLLVNIVLALYVQVAEHRRPALDIAALQLHPDKMKIVTGTQPDENSAPAPATAPAAQPQAAPPVAATPPAAMPPQTNGAASRPAAHSLASAARRPTIVCATLSGIAMADASQAEAALARLVAADGHVERRTTDADRYWVYIPPRSDDVNAEVSKLKSRGVTDYFVVQDHTRWRNAISLGLFRTGDAARTFLAALQREGVTDATVAVRHDLGRQAVFAISALPVQLLPRLDALRHDFPDSHLSSGTCPQTAARAD